MTVIAPARAEQPEGMQDWRSASVRAARRLAAITAAGALVGLLVGGVGGRLAMMALARLNPAADGLTSDDGFVIGQVTLAGTLNLLAAGTFLGVLGAAIYAVLRALMIGPRWFQVLSIAVGPAVVVGEQLVHTDGVDFTLLNPPWVPITLFLLIPGLYAALLTVVAERWLEPDRVFARARLPLALAPLLLFAPLAPALGLLAAGWVLLEWVRRRHGGVVPGANAYAWVGRVALVVVFVVAAVRLVDEVRLLV